MFQGTVLGPPLWNLFFADVVDAAESKGGNASIFADDLNVFKAFWKTEKNEDLIENMEMTRRATHKWGKMNRVTFDGEKEHIIILHPIHGEGDSFKLLGCLMDCKLQMLQAIDAILARMRPKVTAILRLRSHYGPHALIDQFKTHVWGFLECHNGAIFHAAPSYLAKFDRLQEKFLQEINMDEASGFLECNFAPPSLRRNIGILGLLQKRVLGKAHPIFQELLPYHRDVFGSLRQNEHSKQLYCHTLDVNGQYMLHRRSIFGMVSVYNRLPQSFVDCHTVSCFQKQLTMKARAACEHGDPNWKSLFSVNL